MSQQFFTEAEQQQLVDAICKAETDTSGEIRVHIEAVCKDDPYKRATKVFEKLGMHATALHNGILFYLAYEDHKFAVIGDSGIHEKVGQSFWDSLSAALTLQFKEGKYADGLTNAILLAGEQLKKHFPFQSDDKNELSNDISFGKDDHHE